MLLLIIAFLISPLCAIAAEPSTQSFPYKKTPQGELSLTAYYPPEWQAADRRPAIVFFFGGGWQKGSLTQFEPQSQYFARRGLVAFCADYRVKSRHDVDPDDCVADAFDALRWVRGHAAELGIDPDRIIASGGSAGGHLAACTALCPEPTSPDQKISARPNILILFNPVLDFTSERFVERIDGDAKRAAAISPLQHLKADSPPTLIFFGDQDRLAVQGEAFAARAKELGHNTVLEITPRQNHGFFNKPPFRESTLHRTDQFLTDLGYLPAPP